MRTLTLTVDEAWDGSTVKHLLRARLHMAEGLIARIKLRETGLMRNGERVFTTARLHTGDVLCVEIGDVGAVNEALPIAAPLTFVYEDEDIAVLNKSPDMAVHGSTGGQGCTVANALAALWGRETAFHPVSRLDRGTSGRTHQIRVHMAAIGHPLFGDALYGTPDDMLRRPALHSAYLSLRHPVTGERMELTAALPDDLKEKMAALRRR